MGQRAEDRGFSFKAMRIRDQAGKSFFTTDITDGIWGIHAKNRSCMAYQIHNPRITPCF